MAVAQRSKGIATLMFIAAPFISGPSAAKAAVFTFS
jgi:hypothetical protein